MSVGGYLAFTLYVGAAFADANGDQTRLLRTKLDPLIKRAREVSDDAREWRLVAESIMISIHQVMGAQWRPKGEWLERIEAMLGKDSNALPE